MRTMGYVRVSTDEQAREGISLENQKARIAAYCEYRGFTLTGIIEDAGISGGKNRARPGFIEVLNKVESGEAEALVLYSLERLSRDMLTLLALERLLDEHDIELHTVEGEVNTSTPRRVCQLCHESLPGRNGASASKVPYQEGNGVQEGSGFYSGIRSLWLQKAQGLFGARRGGTKGHCPGKVAIWSILLFVRDMQTIDGTGILYSQRKTFHRGTGEADPTRLRKDLLPFKYSA